MMSATKYRKILTTLALSQERMATVLGISKRTSQGYAIGETPIPKPTAVLLWLLAEGKITIGDIETRLSK